MRRGNIRPSGVAAVLLVDVAAHARHHFVHTDSSGCRVIGQPRRISWHSPRSKNRRHRCDSAVIMAAESSHASQPPLGPVPG
jgi:hypothetical protein